LSDNKELEEQLRLASEGSVEAFDRFYARCAPLVMRIAMRMLGDRMEAEDLCHDVMLEALQKGGRYQSSKGTVEAWLAVMTRSRCIDRIRKKQKLVVKDFAAADMLDRTVREAAEGLPEEEAVRGLQRQAVREALSQLPRPQRNAVVGAYYGDMSQREMAEEWEVPLGTVKSWMRYGIKAIRKQLRKRGWLDDYGKEERYESQ